eukprot:m.274290 g.274290  ORF g.274290 m.274290 type:complete len:232 (+) comp68674_c0_seq1:79-774(+)
MSLIPFQRHAGTFEARENVVATFREFPNVASFALVSALSCAEKTRTRPAFQQYALKAMHLFERKRRARFDMPPNCEQLVANFRLACSWGDVVRAFEQLSPKPNLIQQREQQFRHMFGMPEEESDEDRPPAPPQPSSSSGVTPRPMDIVAVREHFAAMIDEVVAELNDAEALRAQADTIHHVIYLESMMGYIRAILRLWETGFPPGTIRQTGDGLLGVLEAAPSSPNQQSQS